MNEKPLGDMTREEAYARAVRISRGPIEILVRMVLWQVAVEMKQEREAAAAEVIGQ